MEALHSNFKNFARSTSKKAWQSQRSHSKQLDSHSKNVDWPSLLLNVVLVDAYILGPGAGQEASGSARPLYWYKALLCLAQHHIVKASGTIIVMKN